ncbi:MAG TPA: helix-turn-helix transcriptional regulator [Steroidobacteraceae bacterium]|nr:helix-turn-helix transcriptional regulator [Steroidobacteraceae bacterium]
MPKKNTLLEAPPYAVEQTLTRLGANLRTARLRRNLTVAAVAEKIGTGPRAVMDAEKGRVGTGAAVYVALLWTYDLLGPMNELADPTRDTEGLALERARGRARPRTGTSGDLDSDF